MLLPHFSSLEKSASLVSMLITDNTFYSDNAIAVPTWTKDRSDTWLLNLLPFLDGLRFCNDVRTILSRHRQVFISTGRLPSAQYTTLFNINS